jgi:hypothetical protein
MISLRDGLEMLWSDLTARPIRISPHQELPFAIFRYDPETEREGEFELRRQLRLFAARLEREGGTIVRTLSLADLLDEGIRATRDWEALADLERSFGFQRAQETLSGLLSGPRFDLVEKLAEHMNGFSPRPDVVFVVRVGVLAPAIYHVSALLKAMKDRTTVPAVLFYPGTAEGPTGLRFYGMRHRDVLASYHVNIYRGGS